MVEMLSVRRRVSPNLPTSAKAAFAEMVDLPSAT
jgi:hypothetical protein